VVTAVGVKTVDEVNTFRNLQVPLLPLGAEVSAFLANGEVLKMDIFRSCLGFYPNFDNIFMFEDAEEKIEGFVVQAFVGQALFDGHDNRWLGCIWAAG
jgi:hypothetical protein